MKKALITMVVASVAGCVWGCASNHKVCPNLSKGIYDGAIYSQELKNSEPVTLQEKPPPTFEQYRRERGEMLLDHDDS